MKKSGLICYRRWCCFRLYDVTSSWKLIFQDLFFVFLMTEKSLFRSSLEHNNCRYRECHPIGHQRPCFWPDRFAFGCRFWWRNVSRTSASVFVTWGWFHSEVGPRVWFSYLFCYLFLRSALYFVGFREINDDAFVCNSKRDLGETERQICKVIESNSDCLLAFANKRNRNLQWRAFWTIDGENSGP